MRCIKLFFLAILFCFFLYSPLSAAQYVPSAYTFLSVAEEGYGPAINNHGEIIYTNRDYKIISTIRGNIMHPSSPNGGAPMADIGETHGGDG